MSITKPLANSTELTNVRIVTPERVISNGRVVIEGDRIVSVEPITRRADLQSGRSVEQRVVLPGLVDIHGDEIERCLFPRSEARIDTKVALSVCDRLNLAAGITSKFHAIAFEDMPNGNRSVELARELVSEIVGSDLLADHRVHARCELTDPDYVDAVHDELTSGRVDYVSLMNHLPGEGQFSDQDQFERRYAAENAPERDAKRLAERRQASEDDRDEFRDRILDAASTADVPVASHDDECPDEVEQLAAQGVTISEYPVTLAAARRAKECGMTTAMGAPNLVRGGSLWGNLSASDAVEAGVVDVLCTDYHPHSLLTSLFVDTGEPVPERVERVTRAPADALGFTDRGRIEPGARADLLVVEPKPIPTVRRAFVGGTEVYAVGGDNETDTIRS